MRDLEKTSVGVTFDTSTQGTLFFHLFFFSLYGQKGRTSSKSVLPFCTRPNRPEKQLVGEKWCLGVVKGGIKCTMLCCRMAMCVSDISGVFYFFSPGCSSCNETGKYCRAPVSDPLKDFDLSGGELLGVLHVTAIKFGPCCL